MNKSLWQKLQPHVIAIAIFFAISCIYCLPAFQGKEVAQVDKEGFLGNKHQSDVIKEKYGYYPLWTNALFSGMPAYQVYLRSNYPDILKLGYLHWVFTLGLPEPASFFFLACLTFYILALSLNIKNRVAVLSALAFAFSSYNAVITMVGHTSKFGAIAYMPAIFAGLILLSQRKYLLGFLVTLIFSTVLFFQNHIQITYYILLVSIIIAIVHFVQSIKNKQLTHFAKFIGLAALAGIMGMLSYAVVLFPTYTYSKETMRGGRSELTHPGMEKNKTKGGLDKSYAFDYSYGITEVLTIAVPRMYGGSGSEMPEGSETAKVFSDKLGLSEDQAEQYGQSMPAYWGPQPGTSGAVYFGAIICLLFIFGCVFYKGWHIQWIIAATVLGVLLAWGRHFSAFNYFLFDHLPFYNKFRAPSMAMVIPQLTVPLLAALGLNRILETNWDRQMFLKKFKQASLIAGIFALVLVGLYFMLDYKSESDNSIRDNLTSSLTQQMSATGKPTDEIVQRANDFGRSVITALKKDRQSLFGKDLMRSLIFMAIAWGLLYLYGKDKIKGNVLSIALIPLVFIDLIGIDLRYLDQEKYVERETFSEYFTPTAADLQILKDTSYYRVFNASDGDPYQLSGATSRTSYLHNNVAGYHPAKLALYNDLLDQLRRGNMAVFNMLNTKYFILADPSTRQPYVRPNPDALGAAWFISAIKYVNNANEEMKALESFNPADTAIADVREKPKLTYPPQKDSLSKITLIENRNDYIKYTSSSKSNGIAVFSEVYYPYGWTATIDGKEVPIARVNYVLRSLPVPAGEHTIEFRFEPSSFKIGDNVSLIIGIISILIVLYGIYYFWKANKDG